MQKPLKVILDGVTMGMTERGDTWNQAVTEADEEIYKPVQETVILARAAKAFVNLHMT